MAKFSAPRGTQDILPSSTPRWQYVEGKFREICGLYGFREIRTPTFEETELFTRHTGATTDIVTKQMYTFEDRGGRSITLRPEGTAPAVRAYIEHNLSAEFPVTKLYYTGRIFRYERPQAGRYREHNQLGVEMLGASDPMADAEVISMACAFFKSLGIEKPRLLLNSVGGPEDRPVYREALQKYAAPFLEELCPTCQGRYETNPLRMLDCKNERCKELLADAPSVLEYICDECKTHFDEVQKHLKVLGIDFEINPHLVRGLDYYTRTVFEFIAPGLGAQDTICGGGRYDTMVEEMGGPATPALGFGMGIERLLLTIEKLGIELPVDSQPDVFVAPLGDEAREIAVKLLSDLRNAHIAAETDYTGKSLKAQMKLADKFGVNFVLIIGEDEVKQGVVVLRDMRSKEQRHVPVGQVVEVVQHAF